MTHVFTAHTGTIGKLDEFETYMLNLRINTRYPNMVGHMMQPNMRNVRFYRITVPSDCEDEFLEDMKPYLGGTGRDIKQKLYFLQKIIGKLTGLEPVKKCIGRSSLGDGWRLALNVLILGKQTEVSDEV